jgi:hypothetical protein
MKRFGYGVTNAVLLGMIHEVVGARAPEKRYLIESLGVAALTAASRETIRGILPDELAENGLGPDDEPNEHGRQIEAAIDWLGHQ